MKDRALEIAVYLAELPDAPWRDRRELARIILDRWPNLGDHEIDRGTNLSLAVTTARLAEPRDELQALIEEARLTFGTMAAVGLASARLPSTIAGMARK